MHVFLRRADFLQLFFCSSHPTLHSSASFFAELKMAELHSKEERKYEKMFETINNVLTSIDNVVWGVPLIVMIMATGIYLTCLLYTSDAADD